MSYTTDIKDEISQNIGSKSEIIAELSGYIRNNGHKIDNSFQLTTETVSYTHLTLPTKLEV